MGLLYSFYINTRAACRFLLFVFLITLYFIRAIFKYITTFDKIKRRQKLIENAQTVAGWILKAFNITLICKEKISKHESSLLVGNHIGFSDIVCLMSLKASVFVTSQEMRDTPFLGQITDLGGCAYVNRKSRLGIQDELKGMVDVLKQGFSIVLYPEAVSTNGEQVLPFKKTLMLSAGLAQKPIRPFVFNTRQINGRAVQYSDRDSVCWYGDQGFFEAMWRSLKLKSATFEIEFLPLVYPAIDEDRTALAEKIHRIISEKYVPFHPNMNTAQTAWPIATPSYPQIKV